MSEQDQIVSKDIPSMTAIAITRQVTVDEISPTAEACVPHLYQAAEKIGANVLGPCVFVYDGCLDDEKSKTYLTMALPIEPGPTAGAIDGLSPELHICEIPPCHCATINHHGTMENICSSYQTIMDHAKSMDMELNRNHFREVYHNWIDYNSSDNLTEVQVAVV